MNYQNLIKYLERKTDESESDIIRDWLKNPENENEIHKLLDEVWSNNQISLKGNKPDFTRILDQLHHQINSQQLSPRANSQKSRNRLAIFYSAFSKIAAILVLPLLILTALLYLNQGKIYQQLSSTSTREIYTKPGTRTKIELSDGTSVWLNDGTTFRYPERFSGKTRDVFVDGEAYFEVKSNPEIPFVVNNPMVKTIVTGTHFNLHAYSADQFFEATLLEGKVRLEKNDQLVNMRPGDQTQYDIQNNRFIQKMVNPENASSWIDGKLIIKDEKLGTAIKKLGRWYNVDIILSERELNNYLFTGTFQDEKLDQTLNLITLALPVRFEFKKVNNMNEIQRTIYMKKR